MKYQELTSQVNWISYNIKLAKLFNCPITAILMGYMLKKSSEFKDDWFFLSDSDLYQDTGINKDYFKKCAKYLVDYKFFEIKKEGDPFKYYYKTSNNFESILFHLDNFIEHPIEDSNINDLIGKHNMSKNKTKYKPNNIKKNECNPFLREDGKWYSEENGKKYRWFCFEDEPIVKLSVGDNWKGYWVDENGFPKYSGEVGKLLDPKGKYNWNFELFGKCIECYAIWKLLKKSSSNKKNNPWYSGSDYLRIIRPWVIEEAQKKQSNIIYNKNDNKVSSDYFKNELLKK